jgi:peptidoglycan/xylan/chitin deacetylase (PgdA/CDA1 family)
LRYPELVARIKADGHGIGNHYYKNWPTLGHSDAEFLRYVQQTENAIGSMGEPKLFRAPGGVAWPRQLRLARAQGYTYVLGCAYPHDPMRTPVRFITWLIEKNLAAGTIVILHDGISDATRGIQALPQILQTTGNRALSVVTIGRLLRLVRKTTK